jgi:phosphatidylglycerol lysyltransferase
MAESGCMPAGRRALPPPRARAGIARSEFLSRLVTVVLVGTAAVTTMMAFGVTWAGDLFGAILPVDASGTDSFDLISAAVALLALAAGIARGKQLAWALGIAIFGSAGVAQWLTLRHPIGGALAVVCVIALVADRVRYRTRTPVPWRRRLIAIVVAGALLVGAESVLLDRSAGAVLDGPASDLEELVGNLSAWLAFDPPLGVQPRDLTVPLEVLDLAARLAIVGAMLAMLRAIPATRSDAAARSRAQAIARRFGHGALLPFQMGDDKYQFMDTRSRGLVVYGQAGRIAVVLGDPIGPPDEAWAAFDGFMDACARDDALPVVYQASSAARGWLTAHGFRTFRIGEEAILDLESFGLDGPRRANLRHTVSRAERGGVTIEWHPRGLTADLSEALAAELAAIDREWRARAGPELGFTIGHFDAAEIRSIALVIAREADGRPSAYATFRPTGSDGGYVLDLMRRRVAGTPGALEAAIAVAALRLRDRGVRSLSLGLAPLAGLVRPDAAPEERALAALGQAVRPLYDVSGLARFKAKFDPRWEPRYVAVRRRRDLIGLSIALLRLHLSPIRTPPPPVGRLPTGPRRSVRRPAGAARRAGRQANRVLRTRSAARR